VNTAAPKIKLSLKQKLLAEAHQNRSAHMQQFLLIATACLLFSQFSSWLVNRSIALGDSVVVIDGLLHLTHIRNLGGVFGMAQGKGWLFALFSVALISALVWYLMKAREVRRYEYIFFAFVAGGGVSNILDRMIYSSVVDFIDVKGIPFWHYIFNTADVFIHIGLWPMLAISLFWHRDQGKEA
jgi:signal peptidase II